jgi:transposase-like protein
MKFAKEKDVKDVSGLNDLIGEISREVIETLLKGELTSFLGFEKNAHGEKGTRNRRNGFSPKTVKSKFGPLEINTPRDRDSEFSAQLLPKGQRDISILSEKVISLYAKGMSTRDIGAHIQDIYNFKISPEQVSTLTEGVLEQARQWQNRPLESIYTIVFLDGICLKMRVDGQVRKITVYNILGLTLDGQKDCLGLWIGETESSRFWLSALNELKNRGVEDILIFCVDNLAGISDAIEAAFKDAEIQKCIVHQIRNSVKHVSYKDRKALCGDLKSIYKTSTEKSGLLALDEFEKTWGKKYPNVAASWRKNWHELSTFFKYPDEIRRLIYTTNPIESMNRCMRKVIKTKSIFPTPESVQKLLYLVVDGLSKKWTNKIAGWSVIYPQLLVYFKERVEKYL